MNKKTNKKIIKCLETLYKFYIQEGGLEKGDAMKIPLDEEGYKYKGWIRIYLEKVVNEGEVHS